ncbi:hypothetical protein HRbin16_01269 [bacterium HR16]|nr:hypothetical protein HRbin16_01269 [bacterium HR16]
MQAIEKGQPVFTPAVQLQIQWVKTRRLFVQTELRQSAVKGIGVTPHGQEQTHDSE